MTADRPTTASLARRILAALAIAAAPALLTAPPAAAGTGDVATDCQPDDATACVMVRVIDEQNDLVPGAQIDIAGADFEASATTNADGPVSVAVPEVGLYTVTLDPGSLPDDLPLPEGAPAEVEVTAQLGSNARAAFRVGAGAEAPAPTASDTATGGADAGGTTGEEAGDSGESVAEAPEGDASTREFSLGQVWQQIGSGLRFGLLLALASIGLNLIFGTTGLSNFAHGEQVTLGAAIGFITINQMGMPVWLGGLLTLALCGLTGLLQDAGIWRPLRKRGTPVMQLMIVTIGMSIALQFLIQMLMGGGSERILSRNPRPLTLAGITLSTASWLSMVIAVVCIIGIALFLTRTRIGRATRAVSDNPALAAATGIDPDKIVRIVWVMATAFAALAGLMIGISFGAFNWTLGMQLLLLMFAAVTLGGLGTAFGALAGSLVIGLVVELSNLVLPSDLRYASALVILILVLLVRPQGLLGRRERIG